jgi:hypothetical protein
MRFWKMSVENNHIRMHLLDKHFKMKWHLVVVYGPAQSEEKEEFLTEFAQVCNKCKGATVIGCDFNITRSMEKNKLCILSR